MKIYDEMVDFVMENVGECFDYCIRFLNIKKGLFIDCFIKSRYVKELENGNDHYCFGITGVELAKFILKEFNIEHSHPGQEYSYMDYRSKEYWIGYVSTFYVFSQEKSYKYLYDIVPYDEFERIYNVYHENEETRIIEYVNRRKKNLPNQLKLARERLHLSQRELSLAADVPIRRIQAYEQYYKDINKCDSWSLYKLACVLNVNMEDLLEK